MWHTLLTDSENFTFWFSASEDQKLRLSVLSQPLIRVSPRWRKTSAVPSEEPHLRHTRWLHFQTFRFYSNTVLQAVTAKSSARTKTSSEDKSGSVTSCSSLVDIIHFKPEQSERSSQSNSRRSSDGETSTKPASPIALLRKRNCGVNSDLLVFSEIEKPSPETDPAAQIKFCPKVLKPSKSQSQLCSTRKESHMALPKSKSSMISSFSPDALIQFSSKPGVEEASDLSDETSSMSSTSLSISENKTT